MKLEPFLTPYTKINSKWIKDLIYIYIKDLYIRQETIKLLKENIGKTHFDINLSRILHDPPPRVMEIKAKINKWDTSKFKRFYTVKEIISQVKRQPTEWESSVQFSCSVVSDSLQLHEPQDARPPCPSPTPRVHPNPCPWSW